MCPNFMGAPEPQRTNSHKQGHNWDSHMAFSALHCALCSPQGLCSCAAPGCSLMVLCQSPVVLMQAGPHSGHMTDLLKRSLGRSVLTESSQHPLRLVESQAFTAVEVTTSMWNCGDCVRGLRQAQAYRSPVLCLSIGSATESHSRNS